MNTKKSNCLYTIIVCFDDLTQGIEQYDAPSPEEAMARFIREAQCLQGFPLDTLSQLISGKDIKLIHIANNLQGVWIWVRAQTTNTPRIKSLLGGQVIQTDRNSPRRTVE